MPFGATFYEEANILCRKCIILMRTIYMQEQVAKLDILIKSVAAAAARENKNRHTTPPTKTNKTMPQERTTKEKI